eukprot:TRINITY_DN1494_c0_g3_i1.p1 TRINITY_DN1494_c0_g3~~TRINITY_DN1494_c0_g3_i1.p1  ORF type:complete len:144 (-),score=3.84 TRINITY_DN1494_c0_g3_i1:103-534(-)
MKVCLFVGRERNVIPRLCLAINAQRGTQKKLPLCRQLLKKQTVDCLFNGPRGQIKRTAFRLFLLRFTSPPSFLSTNRRHTFVIASTRLAAQSANYHHSLSLPGYSQAATTTSSLKTTNQRKPATLHREENKHRKREREGESIC